MTVLCDLEAIGVGGSRVPVTRVEDAHHFSPEGEQGASRYEVELKPGIPLEALLVNKSAKVLVVAFHGATDRKKYVLPRFEWLNTLLGMECSSLYFSDPSLRFSRDLTLAWYTGWSDFDLPALIARWATQAAARVGATRIVFTGSSGGGFAALRVATYVRGSTAVAFNPQTHIADYRSEHGERAKAQYWYVRKVMPHLLEDFEALPNDFDWSTPLGARASVRLAYSEEVSNSVVYVQNLNDASHMKWHYRPFRQVVEESSNRDRVHWVEQEGPALHNPPTRAEFRRIINSLL